MHRHLAINVGGAINVLAATLPIFLKQSKAISVLIASRRRLSWTT
jgi:hypothetical protein